MKLKRRTGFVDSDHSVIAMSVCKCMCVCVFEDVKPIMDLWLLEDTKFQLHSDLKAHIQANSM